MIFIITKSDMDPIERWTLSPAVYLAIVSALANIFLRYTFSRGVEISWWVVTMKENTRIKDLHNVWAHSTSLWSAVSVGRGFSPVALAAIMLALVPASSPLVPRASTASSRTIVAEVDVSVTAAQDVTGDRGTGMVAPGRTRYPSFVSASFADVLQSHLASVPISIQAGDVSLCRSGTCSGLIRAAGYQMSCVKSSTTFNETISNTVDYGLDDEEVVFGTNTSYYGAVGFENGGKSIVGLKTLFKSGRGLGSHRDCSGDLAVRKCSLVPATLEHRVTIANGTSITLDPRYTYKDDKFVAYYNFSMD